MKMAFAVRDTEHEVVERKADGITDDEANGS